MKNSAYWQQRFTQLENAQNGIGAASLPEIERQYRQAQKEIEAQISMWYQRFAVNNGITMQEARQWLTGKELKEFKWSVQDYIKAGEESAVSGQWMKELENASAKFHISRLDALKTHTEQSLQLMFAKQNGMISSTLGNVFQSGYYHSAYELQKGFGIGFDIAGVDQSYLEKVLVKPWAADGYNFSDRIWKNKDKLIQEVHTELSRNIMTGGDPQKAIDAIAKKLNTSKSNAGRLVMTEEAYFSSAAQKQCFDELGVEEYEIVATLDSHTSDICQSLDGQHFPMKDYEAGVTAPPFHVNCRSTTAPYFDENFGQIGERAARDEETGKTYYVPDDLKYQDWKAAFVDGDKSGFDLSSVSGTAHYSHPQAAVVPPPKKEYLTEKKLKALIADSDVQIEDLNKEFQKVNVLYDYETFKAKYNGDYGMIAFDASEEAALKSIGDKIEALEAQKAEWEEKLADKLVAKEKKALTKQKLAIEAQLQQAQQNIKTYSGIWKDDVTTADWSKLNIEGKKKYYEGKFITESDPDLLKKYQDLYNQLTELDTEGKALYDIEAELKKVETQIANLGKPQAAKATPFTPDAYGQRKQLAKRFPDRYTADKYFRPLLDAEWDTLTDEQKFGTWQYTHNSHPINRPLSGYKGKWGRSNFQGVGKVPWNYENINYDGILQNASWQKKFGNATNPTYGGTIRSYRDVIAELTQGIEKATLKDDVWLRRGSDINGLAGLLEGNVISFQEAEQLLSSGDIATLRKRLIGETFQNHAFTSTGIADGAGFGGQIAYRIYAPKGTKAIYAEPQSYFGNTISGKEKLYKTGQAYSGVGGEAEMILQRGTKFRVTDIQKNGSGYEITMEVVEQPDYFNTGFEHTFDDGLTSE